MVQKKSEVVEVPALRIELLSVTLVGDSPLICHRFSKKAKNQILASQGKRVKTREARDPEGEGMDAAYTLPVPGAYGFPASAFKQAAVRAAKQVPGMTMVDTQGYFFIKAATPDDAEQLVGPLRYSEMQINEDAVRLAGPGRPVDLRFRPYFLNWEVDLEIEYNASLVSPEQIVFLLDSAGFGVGVGEWRPEKGGNYGRFHVKKGNE